MKLNPSYIKDFVVKQKCIPYAVHSHWQNAQEGYKRTRVSLEENLKHIRQYRAKVYSFDVFDTVVARTTGSPQGIFVLMEMKLKESGSDIPQQLKENFVHERIWAEVEAEKKQYEGNNIYDIYENLVKKYGLSVSARDFLIDMEIDLDLASIQAVPGIAALIKDLHAHNKRVIYVSDMYLSKDIIKQILMNAGVYKSGDKIYVSNEIKKEKRTGRMYAHVLEAEQCLPAQMFHIGDNFYTDVIESRKWGIRGVHYSELNLNRYEKILLNKNGRYAKNNITFDAVCGAARLARIHSGKEDRFKQTLYTLGACVSGPILLGFVAWVLKQAKDKNLKRLYFLSRDGEVLLKVAERLKDYLGYDIELCYLYASRQAWYLPSLENLEEADLDWIMKKTPHLSIRMVANRIGIDPKNILGKLHHVTTRRVLIDDYLNAEDIRLLRDLLQNSSLKEDILKSSAYQRDILVKYLKQEGLFDAVNYGVVDLGWKGTIQNSLRRILDAYDKDTKHQLYGFYYYVVSDSKQPDLDNNHKISYYGHGEQNGGETVHEVGRYIMEIFTSADHGLTVSYYQDVDGDWKPQFNQPTNKDVISWGLEDFRKGKFDFFDKFMAHGEADPDVLFSDRYRDMALQLLSTIVAEPSREESVVIGDYPLKADQAETFKSLFAPPMNIVNVFQYVVAEDKHKITNWIQATCKRSNRFYRIIFLLLIKYMKLAQKVNTSKLL